MTRNGTDEMPAGAAAPDVPPYRDGTVLRWLAGFAISLIGNQVYFVALGWAAVQTTGAGGAGLILAAGSVPRLVLLLLGGAFVDRWGARRLMLGSDMLRGAVMAAAAVLTAATSPSLIVLVSVAVVFGMVDAMFLPAVGALPQRLVAADQLARLQGMRVVVQRAAIVLGAPLGGAVVATYGVASAFAVNAVSFAVSVVALAAIRLRPIPTPQAPRGTATAGRRPRRRTGRNPGGPPGPAAAHRPDRGGGIRIRVHRPDQRRSAAARPPPRLAGVGLIVGGFGRIPRAGLAYALLSLTMAAALAAMGYAPTRQWAITAAVLLGTCGGVASGLFLALLQAHTPTGYLGRAFSLSSLASYGGIPISYAGLPQADRRGRLPGVVLTGLLVDTLAPRTAFAAGAALAACGGLISLLSPALRNAELPHKHHHPPAHQRRHHGQPAGTGKSGTTGKQRRQAEQLQHHQRHEAPSQRGLTPLTRSRRP